ncbi:hypothetical protein FRC08_018108, partial [Ceratobasidium sp. 394]
MDGAVCRVERTGEGSRTDAIRSIGCTAHDLIQWFTENDYDQFSSKHSSELIAEVDLCREFDILDVLAICYSIQNTKVCSVYTLQRYNCYFLCLTVLAVLTRRVASWETMVTSDEWDSCISSLLDRLSSLSPDDSKRYPITRLCALLEPDNPQSARFIFDALRVRLTSQAGALASYNQAMSTTLWRAAWDSSLQDGLITLLQPTASAILGDESHCGTLFRRAIHTSQEDAALAIRSDNVFTSHYSSALSKHVELKLAEIIEIINKLLRMREIEQPVSFGNRVLSRLSGALSGAVVALAPLSLIAGDNGDEGYLQYMALSQLTKTAKLRLGTSVASALTLDELDKNGNWESVLDEASDLFRKGSTEALLTMVLDQLAAKGMLGPSETLLVMGDALNETRFIVLLASLVTSVDLSRALHSVQEAYQTELSLLVMSGDEPEPS